jgi:hypothetical protein
MYNFKLGDKVKLSALAHERRICQHCPQWRGTIVGFGMNKSRVRISRDDTPRHSTSSYHADYLVLVDSDKTEIISLLEQAIQLLRT